MDMILKAGNNIPNNNNLGQNVSLGGVTFAGVWCILAFIIALVGCFLVYFMFVNSKKEITDKKLAWLKEFLSFNKMTIEVLLKILYYFSAIFVTVSSLALFGVIGAWAIIAIPFVVFFGNLTVRLAYEAALLKVMIWKNTSEINKKIK